MFCNPATTLKAGSLTLRVFTPDDSASYAMFSVEMRKEVGWGGGESSGLGLVQQEATPL